MDNLAIDNALLRPQLADGWVLKPSESPPFLKNSGTSQGFEVNEISLMILNSCDGIQSVESIIELLCAQFPDAMSEIPGDVERVLRNLNQAGALIFVPAHTTELYDIPKKTPPQEKRKLCIGMATYDDYDGVYFSLQAIRLYHPEVLDDIEFVLIDNHPDGPCADSLKRLEHWAQNYRYVPCNSIRGTAVRDVVFREANADYVLCIDSHVLIEAGAIRRLLNYFDANPESNELLQGPLLNDDMRNISTHFAPGWSAGMYGTWAKDSRASNPESEPFEIPMQGLGLFACARNAWPGFNPRFSGFGGEEGYIHEKFRQAGSQTLCLPFLRWLHRFNRPMGTRYSVIWDDRVRNYLIGRDELGLDAEDVVEHFSEHIGEKKTQAIVARVNAEIENPFYYFDAIYCMVDENNFEAWITMQRAFAEYGITNRVIAIQLSDYSQEPDIARLFASRDAILTAKDGAYQNVLLFSGDAPPEMIFNVEFEQAVADIKQRHWSVFYPGEQHRKQTTENDIAGAEINEAQLENTGCLAFECGIYARLLEELPEQEEDARRWLDAKHSLASYCKSSIVE